MSRSKRRNKPHKKTRSQKSSEPPIQRGQNYNKNLRHYRAKKRKALKAAKQRLDIPRNPDIRRTLRPTSRAARRNDRSANYIHPWIRNNPAFRREGCAQPAASPLGLPTEIRQTLLYLCYPLPEEKQDGEYLEEENRAARWKALCARIAELCCVSPVFRVDMEFVGARWKEELRKEESDAREKNLRGCTVAPGHTVRAVGYVSRRQKIKAQLIELRRGKKDYKRKRQPKCWYCEERHPQGDPVCPKERKNKTEWKEDTKVLKSRSRVFWEEEDMKKRKVRFDD